MIELIAPERRAVIPAATAWLAWITPYKLRFTSRAQSAGVLSMKGLMIHKAALFTRMSIGPRARSTLWVIATVAA